MLGRKIAEIAAKVLKMKSMKNGVDVSHHQGIIDWKTVSTQIDFAILKCSEGRSNVDKRFFKNVAECEKYNIPWGAYHFATWNDEDEERDAKSEARLFLSIIKGIKLKPKLPLVLDIESNKPIPYTKKEMEIYVKTFLNEILNEGFDVAIYASPSFLNQYFEQNHPFTNVKLWIADYTPPINSIPGWKKVWMHQYTMKGKLNGINGYCDLNRLL